MSAKTAFKAGDLVRVYGRWPGTVKGTHTATAYVVAYEKHGQMLVGFVEGSALAHRKAAQSAKPSVRR